ncbi:hypothetical protein HRbin17_00398 [bacterium HR17]|jgi:hypothetical protein|uniref:Glycosyl hydrolase family 32 N-terminal domain-containing protein n=1 Tax=Candidatus Fervidibacter japonicus TaxID=2035412 RepID=A0A2H5X9N9_9BACT|nr:hypothetical protein HRbin17_00398 [bacterium HR17]
MTRQWLKLRLFDPRDGTTIVPPPKEGQGNWAGAPSLWHDDAGDLWLVYRLRRPHPSRGYLLRIAHSRDGVRFETVWEMRKEQLGTESLERCALVRSEDGRWRLFVSFVDPTDRRWRIDALEAPSPDRFDPAQRSTVLTADMAGVEGVKDPVLYRIASLWLMFVSFSPTPPQVTDELRQRLHATGDVFATGLSRSATGLAVSDDGKTWHWQGEVFSNRKGAWDSYAGRITAIVAVPPAFVAFYDGSKSVSENYEEKTGVAVSFDLRRFERMSLSAPALVSPYGTGALRYMDVLPMDDEWWCYYEFCRPDGSHELRLSRMGAPRW